METSSIIGWRIKWGWIDLSSRISQNSILKSIPEDCVVILGTIWEIAVRRRCCLRSLTLLVRFSIFILFLIKLKPKMRKRAKLRAQFEPKQTTQIWRERKACGIKKLQGKRQELFLNAIILGSFLWIYPKPLFLVRNIKSLIFLVYYPWFFYFCAF